MTDWQAREKNRKTRIADGALHASGKIIAKDKLVAFLQAVVQFHMFQYGYIQQIF